jgi:hypothetical protein
MMCRMSAHTMFRMWCDLRVFRLPSRYLSLYRYFLYGLFWELNVVRTRRQLSGVIAYYFAGQVLSLWLIVEEIFLFHG